MKLLLTTYLSLCVYWNGDQGLVVAHLELIVLLANGRGRNEVNCSQERRDCVETWGPLDFFLRTRRSRGWSEWWERERRGSPRSWVLLDSFPRIRWPGGWSEWWEKQEEKRKFLRSCSCFCSSCIPRRSFCLSRQCPPRPPTYHTHLTCMWMNVGAIVQVY